MRRHGTGRTVRRPAFSIIEFVIVVGMMATLAGILVPVFFTTSESARISRAKRELDALASSAKSRYADSGTLAGVTPAQLNNEGYLSTLHVDPWGNAYVMVNNFIDVNADGRPEPGTIVFFYTKGANGVAQTNHSTGVSSGDDLSVMVVRIE